MANQEASALRPLFSALLSDISRERLGLTSSLDGESQSLRTTSQETAVPAQQTVLHGPHQRIGVSSTPTGTSVPPPTFTPNLPISTSSSKSNLPPPTAAPLATSTTPSDPTSALSMPSVAPSTTTDTEIPQKNSMRMGSIIALVLSITLLIALFATLCWLKRRRSRTRRARLLTTSPFDVIEAVDAPNPGQSNVHETSRITAAITRQRLQLANQLQETRTKVAEILKVRRHVRLLSTDRPVEAEGRNQNSELAFQVRQLTARVRDMEAWAVSRSEDAPPEYATGTRPREEMDVREVNIAT
ncbi:hypothetical protein FB45DRAFT_921262 [Roridomyces roridus]|uniref:Uncharacterized protein n=1 Tax=Roridomyces roridus TaxID=1738132 RepID=A0AAD7FLW8_9AGAR|nr:hypothetical protein FB45DRAFT_921262 [Roridomyces roridus]